MWLRWSSAVILLLFNASPQLANPIEVSEKQDWWQSAVIYQIYPRSFKDDNNDGIGDLKGIEAKLDHLVDLGITALWLSPIYPSPQVDFGYDISDFKNVDKIFGTLDEFKELVTNAHAKGLKVVLDFVPNHSSDQHEWFEKSVKRDPGYEDYYVWVDGSPDKPPNTWISAFHGPAWTFNKTRGQWYLHQFASAQPDLNFREPRVVEEMKDVLTFWLDLGVDGFRIDIISALFEDKDFRDGPLPHIAYKSDQPETYDMVYQWRTHLDEYQIKNGGETRLMMTETYSAVDKVMPYYGNATHNGAHFPFNFWFITDVNKDSGAGHIKFIIEKWINNMPTKGTANWVLGNHDQHRVASRYGSARVDGLAMISMLLPGVTLIYNGEEIGMENGWVSWEQGFDPQGCNGNKEDWEKNSRDFDRTPYQWNDEVNAGFNEGHETWLPVADNYKELNLAKQNNVQGLKSHYRIYQSLLQLKKSDTPRYGSHEIVALNNDNVLVIVRRLVNNPTVVVVVNVRSNSETVDLSNLKDFPSELIVKIPSTQSKKDVDAKISTKAIELDPHEALVLLSN